MRRRKFSVKESNFNVFIPIDLIKASPNSDLPWRIGGIAATDSKDIEGENIVMDGLDTSYLSSGRAVFNWNHGSDPSDIVGEIDIFKKSNNDLYVEGFLYKGVKKAKEIYDLMKTMAATSKRRLGFSVEGKIREKEDNTIVKSWVKAIAITHEPVNSMTFADLIKSMSGEKPLPHAPSFSEALLYHNNTREDVWQLIPSGAAVLSKSFTIGHVPTEGGLIIVPESLDKKPKVVTFEDKDIKDIAEEKVTEKETKKSLSFEEAMFFVQENGVPNFNNAKKIVEHAISKGEVHGDN